MSVVLNAPASGQAKEPLEAQVLAARQTALSPAWTTWQAAGKRALDIVLSGLLLLLLAPAMAVIAILIRLDSPGPAVFRQVRCGKNGRTFCFLKFRGMVDGAEAQLPQLEDLNEADGPIFKMKNDPRVTRIGRFLRRTSLDELPQLWNVFRGEMSLVGPRPPIPAEVARYETWQLDRLRGLPGITGLWQVSGRSDLTFAEMVRLDIEYLERWSLWLDITILLRTVLAVATLRGAY